MPQGDFLTKKVRNNPYLEKSYLHKDLSVTSLKKQGNRSRTRVRPDDASDHIDKEIARPEPILDESDEIVDIFLTISVADEDRIVFAKRLQLRHLVNQRSKRLFSAHRLSDRNQMTRIVNIENGLDIEHLSDNCRRP